MLLTSLRKVFRTPGPKGHETKGRAGGRDPVMAEFHRKGECPQNTRPRRIKGLRAGLLDAPPGRRFNTRPSFEGLP